MDPTQAPPVSAVAHAATIPAPRPGVLRTAARRGRMSEFFDVAAREGGDDEEEDEEGPGEDLNDTSNDEEEEEGLDEFEQDGFVVGDDQAEGEGGEGDGAAGGEAGEKAKKKKKKKKKDRVWELDEEDYEIAGVDRRKRLRRVGDDDEPIRAQTREELERQIFADGEGPVEGLEDEEAEAAVARREAAAAQRRSRADAQLDEDPMDDWIEHDTDVYRDAEKQSRAARERYPGMTEAEAEALAEAQEIFGDVDGTLAQYQALKHSRGADEEGEGAEEEEGSQKGEGRGGRSGVGRLDPEAARRLMLTERDDEIRNTDLPEREQLREGAAGLGLAGADLAAAAEWICDELLQLPPDHALGRLLYEGAMHVHGTEGLDGGRAWPPGALLGSPSDLRGARGVRMPRSAEAARDWKAGARGVADDTRVREALLGAVRAVLEDVVEGHWEVPALALFRRGRCGELLAGHSEDLGVNGEGAVASREEARRLADKYAVAVGVGRVMPEHRRVRRFDLLYYVQDLAARFAALESVRSARRQKYRQALDAATGADAAAVARCLEALESCRSIPEMDDVDRTFEATIDASEDAALQAGRSAGPGRVARTKRVAAMRRSGAIEFTARFAISAEQLAENLEEQDRTGLTLHVPPDPAQPPEAAAEAFVQEWQSGMSGDLLLQMSVQSAATLLASDFRVASHVRSRFYRHARLTVTSTPEGEAKIEAHSLLGPVKRLSGVPLGHIKSGHFSLIRKAVRDKLVTLTMAFPSEEQRAVMAEMAGAYRGAGGTDVGAAWDDLRDRILHTAVHDHILPALRQEVESDLERQSADHVACEAGGVFWRYATQPPIAVATTEDPADPRPLDVRLVKVCVALWSPGTTPGDLTTLAVIDSRGNLVDLLQCRQLTGDYPATRQTRGPTEGAGGATTTGIEPPPDALRDPRKARDLEDILNLIVAHRPHVVVVGAGGAGAILLAEDLKRVSGKISENFQEAVNEDLPAGIGVEVVEDQVACRWAATREASVELGDLSQSGRAAVGLGRWVLDPLAVLCGVVADEGAAVGLFMGPAEVLLGPPRRRQLMERLLVTAVAQTAVDVNTAVAFARWKLPTLAYVPGLGPRKASALIKSIQATPEGVLQSRRQLREDLNMGPVVYANCAGSLLVQALNASDLGNYYLLDAIRVHPFAYPLAYRLLRHLRSRGLLSATADRDGNGDMDEHDNADADALVGEALDPEGPRGAVAMGADVAGVWEEMAMEMGEGASSTGLCMAALIDVQMEIAAPGASLLPTWRPLSPFRAFLSHAQIRYEDVRQGRVVRGTVRAVLRESAIVELETGVEAVLPKPFLSERTSPDSIGDLSGVVARGQAVAARVLAVSPKLTQADEELLGQRDRRPWDAAAFLGEMRAMANETMLRENHRGGIQGGPYAWYKDSGVGDRFGMFGWQRLSLQDWTETGFDRTSVVHPHHPDASIGSRISQPFVVYLIAFSAEVQRDGRWERAIAAHEGYYEETEVDWEGAEERDRAAVAGPSAKGDRGRKKQPPLMMRRIEHPYFRNATLEEVEKELSSRSVGEPLFSPSTKGPSSLRLTFKVAHVPIGDSGDPQDSIMHVEIKEGGKDTSRRETMLSLGKELAIEHPPGAPPAAAFREVYEDLDEAVARFVEPLVANAEHVSRHRKYVAGGKAQVEDLLRLRLRADRSLRGDYALAPHLPTGNASVDGARAGAFYIAACVRDPRGGEPPVHREYFLCHPDGYVFRGGKFPDLEALVDEFKRKPVAKSTAPSAPPSRPAGTTAAIFGFAPFRSTGAATPNANYAPPLPPPPMGMAYSSGAATPGGRPAYPAPPLPYPPAMPGGASGSGVAANRGASMGAPSEPSMTDLLQRSAAHISQQLGSQGGGARGYGGG